MVETYVVDDYGIKTTVYRHLMQQKLGRRLKPQELIHHVNLDHFDNRIENLMVMSHSEHALLHNKLPKRKKVYVSYFGISSLPVLLTPNEVCERLGVNISDLLKYRKLKKIKFLRLSRNIVRYEESEINQFLEGEGG